ncbi:hypothetical protein A7Q09_05420 [Methylacidiphilum sp. Yel]|nr:hypothetical protein A7Q09_05420 [Methylacidiphilum sp. Yel]
MLRFIFRVTPSKAFTRWVVASFAQPSSAYLPRKRASKQKLPPDEDAPGSLQYSAAPPPGAPPKAPSPWLLDGARIGCTHDPSVPNKDCPALGQNACLKVLVY